MRPARTLAASLAVAAVAAALLAPAAADAATKKKAKKKPAPVAEVPRPEDPNEVTFPTSDGVKLVATWKPAASGPSAPAVLLLHAFSRERREVAGVADAFGARGFSTLALDLRGHGESVWKGGARISLGASFQTNPNVFPRDLEAACAWLRSRAPKVGVVGFSLSGNLAALATATGWAEAGVAVSANAERLPALAGTRPSSPRGLLVLAAEKDPGRAASARALDAAGSEPKAISLYPGTAHAVELFRSEPAAQAAAIDWLVARLGPVPPPPSPAPAAPAGAAP
jgi:dienelactone hydrolase